MDGNTLKKLLIVEDDKSLCAALEERFKEEGFFVLAALDGKTGLNLALKNKPDLILLDIVLPKLNGLDLLKKLRQDVWGKKARVILLTNLSADDKIMKAVAELEPSYYLIKTDWRLDDIVQRVKKTLE